MFIRFISLIFIGFIFCPSNSVANDCLVCNFKYSKKSSQAGSQDPCMDLFGAACLNKDGSLKYKGIGEDISNKLGKL